LLSLGANPLFAPPYFLAACPFLFLLTAGGLEALRRRSPPLARVLLVIAALPYIIQTFGHLKTVSQPDTRALCRQWVEKNIPAGAVVLMDASGPPLRMTTQQLEDLHARAKSVGHIKADLFALELEAHQGGGYRLFLTEQALMLTPKDQLAYSRAVQDLLPIDRGLDWIKAQGVQYVVISSAEEGFYRNPARLAEAPAHAKFYDDLRARGRPLAEFPSGRGPGPGLWVYAL